MFEKKSTLKFSFHRDYKHYTGGHQKFRDYLLHTVSHANTECSLFVQKQCSIMPDFFNHLDNVNYQQQYTPEQADIVFLAGIDWRHYLQHFSKEQPIINLIQHVRHGEEGSELFSFLQYKALRICVSDAVRDAIAPYANGDCVTIPMGHDFPNLSASKDVDLYVLGKKNPDFAGRIAEWARRRNMVVHIDSELVTRDVVLSNMARSKITLALPNPTEGFFLPGIEAMALSARAIVPDCIANREYCQPFTNATLCEYTESACIRAIEQAIDRLQTPMQVFEKFRGTRLARQYTLDKERKAYHKLLNTQ